MKLKITHSTQYEYDEPVKYALQQVRLTPASDPNQTVLNWKIDIEGGSKELAFCDQYGNETLLVQAKPGTSQVVINVSGEIETHSSDGIYGKRYGVAPLWHFVTPTPRTMAGPGIHKLSKIVDADGDTLSSLHTLSRAILEAVPYNMNPTSAGTTAEEALNAKGGVCQDHAQIFISAARHAGIPARYISGYLLMDDRVDQDASHAWAEAHVPDLGWVGFDVSNGISPDERYVRIAVGCDSLDAAPTSGMRLGQAAESMIVSLQIQQ
ncbi:transglutaminase-like putative cysteine protease [Yoonia maritima]|uniref:Transglutaminase-like putative cysteine protease n=1 Tax=Yoonia maritima TaxID=1435347 RepID=A0A2T0VTB7_9RHOB|nr:transglutaminase family protein [Yoonia maritima]PRY74330.1 transglutaminase-like putative cysteine protease [Yoonia maritima]